MGFAQGANTWLSIIWKTLGLAVLALVGIYIGLSIWGNVSLHNDGKPPPEPAVDKATYEILLLTTGEKLLTSDYTEDSTQYTLNGFYALEKGEWKHHDDTIILDEYYFGKILISRR